VAERTGQPTQSLELHSAFARHWGAFANITLFSVVMNILLLTGPLFMLQVYDRVLASRSSATLLVLFAIVVFLYAVMGILDHVRSRMLSRIGADVQTTLDDRVFRAVLRQAEDQRFRARPASGLRDLSTLQGFLSSSLPGAVLDLPWAPVFAAFLFVFHPWLGWFAIGGAVLLFILAAFNQRLTTKGIKEAGKLSAEAEGRTETTRKNIETVQGLGMVPEHLLRWNTAREAALDAAMKTADSSGGISVGIKTFRMLLQSAILGLAAYLVIKNELTGGAMIAASVLFGRALSPIEQLVGQWSIVEKTTQAWTSLNGLLSAIPTYIAPMELPRPESHIEVRNLVVTAPGDKTAIIQGISFEVLPGEAVAVIGASASGKSTLARAMAGVWPIAHGDVRLGGADIAQYDRSRFGRLIGYLPQEVVLFDGTIAENIARFETNAKPEDIVKAAEAAGAHQLILGLPNGYETPVAEAGARLSGGQRQRISLARAFYGDPIVLLLDEPNSALDDVGLNALNQAIARAKAADLAVIIMSHRPSTLSQCDKILLIENGRQRAFGPREEVLQKFVKNAPAVLNTVTRMAAE
jgi:PrtD family type I secretion system ABC transporter